MMNQVASCAKCSSPNVIPKVRVIDHWGWNLTKDLTIELYDNPQALVHKGALTMSLYAWVCGECGYTELYVDDPKELFFKYTDGYKTGSEDDIVPDKAD
jgi:predicted nucleic-acid-binding Zn-ribbon protein